MAQQSWESFDTIQPTSMSSKEIQGHIYDRFHKIYEALIKFKFPICIGLISGLITIAFGTISSEVVDNASVSIGSVFSRWDAVHYEQIANEGYSVNPDRAYQICYCPLFPLVSVPFVKASGDPTIGLLIVSNAAFIIACVGLFQLSKIEFSEPIANAAVTVMAVFPTAYFFHLGYTESLFISLAILTFACARKQLWFLAGACAFMATLTRLPGAALMPTLIIEYLHINEFRAKRMRADIVFTLMPVVAIAIYVLINYTMFGDPLYFLKMQAVHFNREFDWPWVGLQKDMVGLWTATPNAKITIHLENLFSFSLASITIIWSIKNLRPCYTVYSIMIWILTFCYSFTLSAPRYMLAMFPIFFFLAHMVIDRPIIKYSIGFISVLLYGLGLQQFARGWWSH